MLHPPGIIGSCLLNGCDFCVESSCSTCAKLDRESAVYSVNGDPFFGWLCCECLPCQEKCKASQQTYTYPIADLRREFKDDLFSVLRSDGQMDPPGTWTFCGDGWYSDRERQHVRLIIRHQENAIRKCITLMRLRSWQPATNSVPSEKKDDIEHE